jgi:phage terminase large subunit
VNKAHYGFLCRNSIFRKLILYGGAGSGKSWAIAQYLILEKFYKEKQIGILVVRATLPALKSSAYALILATLDLLKLPYKLNKSDMIIRNPDSGNFIMFRSLDDVEKIKSIEGINYVWMEEATEISHKDYMQLNIRARAQNDNEGSINQVFCSFNPVDVRSFLKKITDNPPEGVRIHHSTYKDNAFLTQDYIDELEELIEHDRTYHLIYAKGLWASPGNIIYTNWKVTPVWPENRFNDVGYGLDFGFNAPTALVEIGHRDDGVWERERLYETKLTNTQLIEKLKVLIPPQHRHRVIMADSAEPDRIEEIFDAGFNIFPCTKGPNSVRIGIDRVKRHKILIHNSSTNLIEEKQGYKWKEDKYGNTLDEPVPYKDHLMDAERYYLGETPAQPVMVVEAGSYDLSTGGIILKAG